MKIITKISLCQKHVDSLRKQGRTIGLVPTMGALHEGHLSLVKKARGENDTVVVSIFVNPAQFGPGEDYKKYPRAFAGDKKLCEKEKVDIVFCPAAGEMYPGKDLTAVNVEGLTDKLCGRSRTGHFKGVCTVVSKLFNIVKPHTAYFGQKDYQQFLVIRKMARDMNFHLKLRMCPTVREGDGLALSSRNRCLSPKERTEARCLHRALESARYLIKTKRVSGAGLIISRMKAIINEQPGARVDYINICDPETLEDVKSVKGKVLVGLAVFVGKTRLIDNVVIS